MSDVTSLVKGDVVQIHMLEGNANGPRILDIANTNSRAIACPRVSFQDIREEPEFGHPGVYILVFDPSVEPDAPDERIYIGESDELGKRLVQHTHGDGRENWDWNWFAAFTSRDQTLDKAHVKYIEARLIEIAKATRRADLTQSSPDIPHLDRPKQAICERFLQQIRIYCPLLGIHAFDSTEVRPLSAKAALQEQPLPNMFSTGITVAGRNPELYLESSPDVQARGAVTSDGGFVVFKGSTLRRESRALLTPPLLALRTQILASGVESNSEGYPALTSDVRFNSPSQAAAVLLAYRVSGWDWWKNEAGQTMNDVERALEALRKPPS